MMDVFGAGKTMAHISRTLMQEAAAFKDIYSLGVFVENHD